MMRLRERCVAFELDDELVVGMGLLPGQIDVEAQERDQADDRDVIRG